MVSAASLALTISIWELHRG